MPPRRTKRSFRNGKPACPVMLPKDSSLSTVRRCSRRQRPSPRTEPTGRGVGGRRNPILIKRCPKSAIQAQKMSLPFVRKPDKWSVHGGRARARRYAGGFVSDSLDGRCVAASLDRRRRAVGLNVAVHEDGRSTSASRTAELSPRTFWAFARKLSSFQAGVQKRRAGEALRVSILIVAGMVPWPPAPAVRRRPFRRSTPGSDDSVVVSTR